MSVIQTTITRVRPGTIVRIDTVTPNGTVGSGTGVIQAGGMNWTGSTYKLQMTLPNLPPGTLVSLTLVDPVTRASLTKPQTITLP
jgi:hypothetical protein